MSQDNPFLQAIIDNPDDDTPRLIYADWLEERGDVERAEFIRLGCELATMPSTSEKDSPQMVRSAQLLGANSKVWNRPFNKLIGNEFYGYWLFQRGFVELVEVSINRFLEIGSDLFAMAPIQHAVLRSSDSRGMIVTHEPVMQTLASASFLRRVRTLDLARLDFGQASALALAASPHLTQLKELILDETCAASTEPALRQHFGDRLILRRASNP